MGMVIQLTETMMFVCWIITVIKLLSLADFVLTTTRDWLLKVLSFVSLQKSFVVTFDKVYSAFNIKLIHILSYITASVALFNMFVFFSFEFHIIVRENVHDVISRPWDNKWSSVKIMHWDDINYTICTHRII